MKKESGYLFLLLLTFSSCKKFLEEKTQSDMTPVSTEDYNELFFGTGYLLSGESMIPQVRYLDDDVQCYNGFTDLDVGLPLFNTFTWQPVGNSATDAASDPFNVDSYKTLYKKIIGCNIAIQMVDGSKGDPAKKNQLIGEAYTLRAFYYFTLANLYSKPFNDSTTTPAKSAGVPLILSANLLETPIPRNSVEEVYNQIRADLDSASIRLERSKLATTDFRISHTASRLFASRVYLFTEQWDKVIASANYVIQNRPQMLDVNAWPVSFDPTVDALLPVYAAKTVETLWIFGDQSDYGYLGNSGEPYFEPSEDLGSSFEPDDLRLTNFMFPVPPFLKFIFPQSYLNYKRSSSSTITAQSGGSWRVTEAYMNRAEAYAQKYIATGDISFAQKCLQDLNAIRSKRFRPDKFVPVTMMPGTAMLEFCRNERRREFYSENMRWFDLKRYGMPSLMHYYERYTGTIERYVLEKRDPAYVLPIPTTAIELNKALVQNPAWVRRNMR